MHCDVGGKDKRSGLIAAKGGKEKALRSVALYNAEHAAVVRSREQNLHIYRWQGQCPSHCSGTHLQFVGWNVSEHKSLEMSQALSSSEVPLKAHESSRWDNNENEEYTHVLYRQRLEEHSELCRKLQSAGCCCSMPIRRRY